MSLLTTGRGGVVISKSKGAKGGRIRFMKRFDYLRLARIKFLKTKRGYNAVRLKQV